MSFDTCSTSLVADFLLWAEKVKMCQHEYRDMVLLSKANLMLCYEKAAIQSSTMLIIMYKKRMSAPISGLCVAWQQV